MKYACSICCCKTVDYKTTVEHSVFLVEAISKTEAFGLAMLIAYKVYPINDGFTCHHAKVCELTNVVNLEGARLS